MKASNMKQAWKRLRTALLIAALSLAAALAVLQAGALHQTYAQVHWTPDYEKVDILPLLQKAERTQEDYAVLYAQTGLTHLGIEDLLEVHDIHRILEIQTRYFEEYTVETDLFAPFTSTQTIDGRGAYGRLRNGDLIISSSAFFSWFRCGHAAMMVDAPAQQIINAVSIGADSALEPLSEFESRISSSAFFSWFRCGHAAMMVDAPAQQIINAVSIGADSALEPLSEFESRANFMVLRPKLPTELRESAASYAKSWLVGLPYQLTAGLLTDKFESPVTSTQCAHLVWYAYQMFGVDLDSNGGRLVTPKDLAQSPLVELVQTFGFDPQRLWS